MRFLHLADLHLGKTLHRLSLIESGDQPYWVDQILDYIQTNKPDAVVIAGDVYDRGVPARDAITLLSRLLTGIARMGIPVMLTAGNHDGGERMEFAAELLAEENVYIAGTVQREMLHVTRDFGDGPVTFWLMPYVFPAAVREALGLDEDAVTGYTDAVRALLAAQNIDYKKRNVLIAHQTVISADGEPEHSASETAIGGVGGVDVSVFDGFDYVALGHIHGAQKVVHPHIRYAGAPLCYHFSEANQRKGPLMVTLGAKGEPVQLTTDTLPPLHRVRPTMTGELAEIMQAELASDARNEYVRVVLTDDLVPPDTHETLRALFESHGCRLLDIGREPNRHTLPGMAAGDAEEIGVEEHFLRFFRKQTGADDPDAKEAAIIRLAAEQLGRGGERDEDALLDELVRAALKQEGDAR